MKDFRALYGWRSSISLAQSYGITLPSISLPPRAMQMCQRCTVLRVPNEESSFFVHQLKKLASFVKFLTYLKMLQWVFDFSHFNLILQHSGVEKLD